MTFLPDRPGEPLAVGLAQAVLLPLCVARGGGGGGGGGQEDLQEPRLRRLQRDSGQPHQVGGS